MFGRCFSQSCSRTEGRALFAKAPVGRGTPGWGTRPTRWAIWLATACCRPGALTGRLRVRYPHRVGTNNRRSTLTGRSGLRKYRLAGERRVGGPGLHGGLFGWQRRVVGPVPSPGGLGSESAGGMYLRLKDSALPEEPYLDWFLPPSVLLSKLEPTEALGGVKAAAQQRVRGEERTMGPVDTVEVCAPAGSDLGSCL